MNCLQCKKDLQIPVELADYSEKRLCNDCLSDNEVYGR